METEIRLRVIKVYNYLFYGMDNESPYHFGLHQFYKADAVEFFPQLKPLLSEGEPTVFPLGYSLPNHGQIEDPNHGGPLGYEIYINNPGYRHSTEFLGTKFTVYHQGSGFLERSPDPGRPISEQDLPSLDAVIKLIQRMYQATFPGSYRTYLQLAQENER